MICYGGWIERLLRASSEQMQERDSESCFVSIRNTSESLLEEVIKLMQISINKTPNYNY